MDTTHSKRSGAEEKPRSSAHLPHHVDSDHHHHGHSHGYSPKAPQNFYSAIPGLIKRSVKGCVPRICHLKVSKIEALSQLTSSKSTLKLVVVMYDGRSRLRDSARHGKVKRAALSSFAIPIQSSETFSAAPNINFYMQYFHNFKQNRDSVRVLLQKGKNGLRNKVIAECTISLADILQYPLDGELVLHSTGKLKRAQQAVNAPLVRLNAQLESISLDKQDLEKWWPEDAANLAMVESLEKEGILSGEDPGSEDDDAGSEDGHESEDEDDEWVETCETILSPEEDNHDTDIIAAGLGSSDGQADGLSSGDHHETEKEKFGKVFRSKVINGTRKIASITLNPVRAVKNRYERMKKKGKRREGQDDVEFDEHFPGEDDSAEECVPSGGEETDEPQYPMSPSAAENEEGEFPEVGFLVSQVEGILAISQQQRLGPVVVLMNNTTRRGQKVQGWLETASQISKRDSLWQHCVCASSKREIRSVLRVVIANYQLNAEKGRNDPSRIAILGSDAYVNSVVQEYIGLRSHQTRTWEAEPPVRFYPVPVGKRGRDLAFAQQLASKDEEYQRLFFVDSWHEALDADVTDGWTDTLALEMVDKMKVYLSSANETLRLDIAEVFVTSSDNSLANSGPSESAGIVQQHTLPFISSLFFRGEGADSGPATGNGFASVDLKVDFWVAVGAGDFMKASSHGPHLEVQVRRACDATAGRAAQATQGVIVAPMTMQAFTVKPFKEKSKKIRSCLTVANSGSGSLVKTTINKLICTGANPKAPNFTVLVDGVRWTHVRFVSVSPHLSSSLIKTLPVATFRA